MERLIIKILLTTVVIISVLSCDDRCGDAIGRASMNNTTSSLIKVSIFSSSENMEFEIPRESSHSTNFNPEFSEEFGGIVPDSVVIENPTKTITYRHEQFGDDLSKQNHFFEPANWKKTEVCRGIDWNYEYSIRSEDFDN